MTLTRRVRLGQARVVVGQVSGRRPALGRHDTVAPPRRLHVHPALVQTRLDLSVLTGYRPERTSFFVRVHGHICFRWLHTRCWTWPPGFVVMVIQIVNFEREGYCHSRSGLITWIGLVDFAPSVWLSEGPICHSLTRHEERRSPAKGFHVTEPNHGTSII